MLTAELYPTQQRAAALGVTNHLLGRIGLVLGPIVTGRLAAALGSTGDAVRRGKRSQRAEALTRIRGDATGDGRTSPQTLEARAAIPEAIDAFLRHGTELRQRLAREAHRPFEAVARR